jgi:predicted nucleic acid-binding protein
MYLLDTNVLSELRRIETGRAHHNVAAWVSVVAPSSMYLSTVTVFEVQAGISRVTIRDPSKAAVLKEWLEYKVLPTFEGRIISVDMTIAKAAGMLIAAKTIAVPDVLIAATALVGQLTLVTRNTSHFATTGVELLDPWISPNLRDQ